MKEKKSKGQVALITTVVTLAVIYAAGLFYFNGHTFANTEINGQKLSYVAKNQIFDKIKKPTELKIKGRDNITQDINLSDINYKLEPNNMQINQNIFAWPISFFKTNKQEVTFNKQYDVRKLHSILDKSPIISAMKAPEDAHMQYSKEEGNWIIAKEQQGTKLDPKKLYELIDEKLEQAKGDIDLEPLYEKPKVYSDDKGLIDKKKQADELSQLSVKLKVQDKTIDITKGELMQLTEFNDKGKIELNWDKTLGYFKYIADTTDTYGKQRTFNATDIGEITVEPGLYGWRLDTEKTALQLYDFVDNRKSGEYEATYLQKAEQFGPNDIGNNYIEIDLSRQLMWLYLNGEMQIETNIVSGVISKDWPTNVGVGKILSKERNTELKGQDFDGSRYSTPVSYWMPIGWDGEGIHDADWRSSFGGGIYLGNGSHGCINTPPGNAAYIFENSWEGMPVVVYESYTSYSPGMSY